MDCCAPATSLECMPPSMCTMALPSRASAWAASPLSPRARASRWEMDLYWSNLARFWGEEMSAISQSRPRVVLPTEINLIRLVLAARRWKYSRDFQPDQVDFRGQ